jgi:hypothetical protein
MRARFLVIPGRSRGLGWLLAAGLAAAALHGAPVPEPVRPDPSGVVFGGPGPRRADVISPSEFLGYEPGARNTAYADFLRLLEAWSRVSDRLRVQPVGRTAEGRPLQVLIVSSPANLGKLTAIKDDNRRLSDPRVAMSDPERDALVERLPVIVWLGYGVHGDESAGLEAAMEVAHTLLASTDVGTAALLERAVVLINPSLNPDGRERFVTWYTAHGRGRAEPYAFEKENPWVVSGRLNHHLFDLNRDMLALSQPESRVAAAAFLEWRPHVMADHHGETSAYFFPPAALPINPHLPRAKYEAWLERFGRANAEAFDRQGWMYYVRDTFDLFYPGYWDSWASLQGAIGMTYETEGGGKKGLREERDDRTLVTLRQGVAEHVRASLTTLETAVRHREERLRSFREFFVGAVGEARTGAVRRYLLPPPADLARLELLAEVLRGHGVELQRTTRAMTLKAAALAGPEAGAGAVLAREFPAGTLVVDVAQPAGRIARAVLEAESPQDDAFLRRQEEIRRRNALRGEDAATEDFEFYDLTAWSLPLCFDLPVYAAPESEVLPAGVAVAGWERAAIEPPGAARSAYVFSPVEDGAYRLALELLGEDFRVGAATRPLRAAGRDFPRGTFVVRTSRNPAALAGRMAALATRHRVAVTALDTAFTDEGITGVGSWAVAALKAPKVLLVAGEPTRATVYGSVERLLVERYGVDVVPVAAGRLKDIPLEKYGTVILPDGEAGAYAARVGKSGIERLRAWVKEGGTVIALGRAAEFVGRGAARLVNVRSVGEEEAEADDAAENDPAAKEPAADATPYSREAPAATAKPKPKATASGPGTLAIPAKPGEAAPETELLPIPGAILRTRVDPFHFLAFGYEREWLPALVEGDLAFVPTRTGTNVVTFAAPDEALPLRIAGFVWPDNTERLIRGAAAVVEEPLGEGRVILFAIEPGKRLLGLAASRLLLNAVLYGPAMQGRAAGE